MVRTVYCAAMVGTLLLGVSAAAAQTMDMDPVPLSRMSSTVGFTVFAKALFTFKAEGRFTDFDGQVAYNPINPAATRLDVTVHTASVNTSSREHDEMLRSEGFFDIGRYPTMRFVSTDAELRPDGALAMSGDLTIRGVTKHIHVPVRIRSVDGVRAATLETTFDIDRTEFGINGSPNRRGFTVSIAKRVNVHLVIATALPRFNR